jgi:proteasome lid subunit RPN8/RPN11
MGWFDWFRRDKPKAPPPPRRRRVWGIRKDVLDMVQEAARASHPNEFGATLRAEKGVVTELILVPGTLGGDKHAILPLGYLPVDPSIVGTIHSHPGPWAIPSDADKQLFNAFGHTHIIIAEPYTDRTWIAYDQNAERIELLVVDD